MQDFRLSNGGIYFTVRLPVVENVLAKARSCGGAPAGTDP
jgi:hypothetical protein